MKALSRIMLAAQYSCNVSDINGSNIFEKDRAAAMILSFANLNTKNLEGMNWDMAAAPTLADLPGVGFQPYASYLCVTSMSRHKDAGMEIIKYLTSDDFQLMYSKQPAKDKNLQAVFYNKFASMPKGTMYDQMVQRAYIKALPPALTGETDVNTAFRNAAETADKAIEGTKQAGIKTKE
jgi:multiple sugar transport system substrate-binding protein